MDSESTKAVAHERHEIHLRPAVVSQASLGGHHRPSQAQAHHGRRIVIPEVTGNHQGVQKFTRQDAEVANFDWQSSEESMAQLIEFSTVVICHVRVSMLPLGHAESIAQAKGVYDGTADCGTCAGGY
jgi:hypothetical protein